MHSSFPPSFPSQGKGRGPTSLKDESNGIDGRSEKQRGAEPFGGRDSGARDDNSLTGGPPNAGR